MYLGYLDVKLLKTLPIPSQKDFSLYKCKKGYPIRSLKKGPHHPNSPKANTNKSSFFSQKTEVIEQNAKNVRKKFFEKGLYSITRKVAPGSHALSCGYNESDLLS
jgi:hypothetical protein